MLCRWVAGQLLHYAHCMFYHRHVYRHILFWWAPRGLRVCWDVAGCVRLFSAGAQHGMSRLQLHLLSAASYSNVTCIGGKSAHEATLRGPSA